MSEHANVLLGHHLGDLCREFAAAWASDDLASADRIATGAFRLRADDACTDPASVHEIDER